MWSKIVVGVSPTTIKARAPSGEFALFWADFV
jgi:hypothetical protein